MNKLSRFFAALALSLALLFSVALPGADAQLREPDVKTAPTPLTPLSQGYHHSLTANVMINNFGFGLAGQYSLVLGPYTNLTLKTGITGIRNVSEQTFQDFFSGQRIIPNKYKRAIGFPLLIGVEKRLFADQIADNFRLFISAAGGPAMAFVYPYLNDVDGNGYRSFQIFNGFRIPDSRENYNDFFTGWKNGESEWGAAGELKLGVNLGENFKRQTTIEFGYFFYYFHQGIQIMQPRRPVFDNTGQHVGNEDFFEADTYFGTPQITVRFGGMW